VNADLLARSVEHLRFVSDDLLGWTLAPAAAQRLYLSSAV
jgi:hypothetical protein